MKLFAKPPVGASISVTTRYKETYYYATNEWRDTTYVGRVLPPEPWFKDGDFKLSSDDPKMSFRVINLKSVIDLKINGRDADLEDVDDSNKVVTVRGSKGGEYYVTLKSGTAISCTCPGFTYRHTCRHLKDATGDVDSEPKVMDSGLGSRRSRRPSTFSVHKRGNEDMSKSKTMSWNDRFALIDHYKPSDEQARSAFGVTQDELKTAREMRSAGAFTATPDIDVKSYANLFSVAAPASADSTPSTKSTRRSSSTSTVKPSTKTSDKPATATKKTKEPKKRGRKGDNIAKAFAAIPASPTPVNTFANSHGVSIAVLRQSKRFDKSPELGSVRVKKDKESKTLMIWREAAPTS